MTVYVPETKAGITSRSQCPFFSGAPDSTCSSISLIRLGVQNENRLVFLAPFAQSHILSFLIVLQWSSTGLSFLLFLVWESHPCHGIHGGKAKQNKPQVSEEEKTKRVLLHLVLFSLSLKPSRIQPNRMLGIF